ncbi:MAG: bifunctional D-glycero-beta-D-manno-heptose-7-phosphate kinase/D-glycero-beta-D-manno-heptose 1-phosphate adenylyltransferase HldE [Gammaproteobacteria bacterium]|nr:bifunctional D-glycero-beta-D-manno-heptose-7-phosphate kinase/D-glycero-beta-D-manno-heptose 1-phosphate adenylyltransferase HldE [Gammaproteobacteria bacterium]
MSIQFPDFSKAKVLVVGDVMLDRYFHGDIHRISPEAPVPVARIVKKEDRLGGASNVAFNISSLGAHVKLLGLVGNDSASERIKLCLTNTKIAHDILQDEQGTTITKIRVLKQQQLLRLDFEDGFADEAKQRLFEIYKKVLPEFDVVVISNYGKGTFLDVREYMKAAQKLDIPVLVDPKHTPFEHYRGAALIKPNRKEFEAVVGECRSDDELIEKGCQLIKKYDFGAVLVTRGHEGLTLIQKDQPATYISTQALEVFDVTGAGDTVISVLAASLAVNTPLIEAVKLSNIAAGIAVSKLGTVAVTRHELFDAVHADHLKGVLSEDQMVLAMESARRRGERIVMTNGCFDVLHAGHIYSLQQAKQHGDRLVVAVNDDDSVRRLKGQTRPINHLEDRMAVLAALECVDWAVSFSEDTPERLICRLLPDVLVKGSDYKEINAIAGAQCVLKNGGEVKALKLLESRSSSEVIKHLQPEYKKEGEL